MKLYILLFLILISCSSKNHIVKEEFSTPNLFIKLNDNIKKDGLIKIEIFNKSKKSLKLSSPKCWVNTSLTLKDAKGLSIPSIKIKPFLGCTKEYLTVQSGEKKTVYYNYDLYRVFPSLKKGTYFLYATYFGKIKDIKNNNYKNTKPLITNTVRLEL